MPEHSTDVSDEDLETSNTDQTFKINSVYSDWICKPKKIIFFSSTNLFYHEKSIKSYWTMRQIFFPTKYIFYLFSFATNCFTSAKTFFLWFINANPGKDGGR